MNLSAIYNDVQNYLDKGLRFKALATLKKAMIEAERKSIDSLAEICFEYACILFESEYYPEALDIFVKTYNLSYNQEAILEILGAAYTKYSADALQINFSKIQDLIKIYPLNQTYNLDNLTYSVFAFIDSEYYIFNNLNKTFSPKISGYNDIELHNEFSDIMIIQNRDAIFSKSKNSSIAIASINSDSSINKNIYFISNDIDFTLVNIIISDVKHKNRILIFNSNDDFKEYFHTNTGISMPRNIYSDTEDTTAIKSIIDTEHTYRLTLEGRNTDNIILSIAIPSYNRGHLALSSVNSLLESEYDCEIEIVVSNNGSLKNTEGYKVIKNLKDSRISYSAFEETCSGAMNFTTVICKSKGKFACTISDEDVIINSNLAHYLNILKNNPDLSKFQSTLQGTPGLKTAFYEKGDDALYNLFFTDNYLSGSIYNVEQFKNSDVVEITERYSQSGNKFALFYPMCVWTMWLCYEGRVGSDSIPLINPTIVLDDSNITYVTLQERLQQHIGCVEIIKYLRKLKNVEDSTMLRLYVKLCAKIAFLIGLNKRHATSKHHYLNFTIDEIHSKTVEIFLDGATELGIDLHKSSFDRVFDHYSIARSGNN